MAGAGQGSDVRVGKAEATPSGACQCGNAGRIAEEAKSGCLVSRILRPPVTLEARLAPGG